MYEQEKCAWCGAWHTGVCPRVRSIEYHPNGTVKRVEFVAELNPLVYPALDLALRYPGA